MQVLEEIKIPQENVNDDYITVMKLHYKNNDYVNEGNELVELESSKTVFSITATKAGYIEYFCNEDDEIPINQIIIKIYDTQHITETVIQKQIIQTSTNEIFETLFSKNALNLITEKKIDKSLFKDFDFVTKEVIELVINPQFVKKEIVKIEQKTSEKQEFSNTEIKKISPAKKREIEYLAFAQGNNLISTVNIKVNTKNLFYNINNSLQFLKNSILPIIVYEVSKLLIKFPVFNSFYYDNQIFTYKDVNLGIAMDIDKGLKTVKIKNTNQLNIQQIENQILELANKYIANKLQTDDVSEITFTITDLSAEKIYSFIPLVNKYNSAILGISSIDEKTEELILTLSFDHRVTEGRSAAIFLRELKNRLESYAIRSQEFEIKCFKCFKSIKDDYNQVGFLKTIIATGEEKYICQTCFNGF